MGSAILGDGTTSPCGSATNPTQTTQAYLHADVTLKERALAGPFHAIFTSRDFRPDDQLLAALLSF